MELIDIFNEFQINGKIENILNQTDGLINKSYVVKTNEKQYIIQKINTSVFKEPKVLMNNIEKVIKYLNQNKKINCAELQLIPTKVGNNCLIKNNEFYRCYNFIDNSITYNQINNYCQMYELGKIIGKFQNDLKDIQVFEIKETIKDFHNTNLRFLNLVEVFKKADKYLQSETISLYLFIIEYKDFYNKIIDKLNRKEIPYRVVHNDTKLNNVIFNKNTNKAKCLIDFDTIMPGSLLFDFGDALRSSASTEKEDSKNFEKIAIDEKLFTYFFIGFYKNVKNLITKEEIALLVDSIFIITIECAIRFLTDYLEENKYFKISYLKHNLVRAKNQLILAKDIDKKRDLLNKIIKKVIKHFEILN